MNTNHEPPSRRVSRESLGDWALKDVMAHRALRAGLTEAELIHALLQDRERLMEQLQESLSRTPPPIVISQPEPAPAEVRSYLVPIKAMDSKDPWIDPALGEPWPDSPA